MIRYILFFVLNFGALALGSYFIGSPVSNQWYQGLHKAPWTPPGWVFGAAWFTIMACFTVFMAQTTNTTNQPDIKRLYILFIIQWILNVSWNPVFFRWHLVAIGLIIIIILTLMVGAITWIAFSKKSTLGFLMLPYLVWLIIATSLNAYVLVKN